MTEAEKAFEFAERLIEEARESGAEELNFDREETRALDRLPKSLGNLTQLETLDCDNTQISDLGALSGLTQLTQLWLNDTSVSDLGALSGLTQLTSLGLNDTSVSDLGALSGLTQLTELGLNDTSVSDLGALSGLTQLARLWLNDTSVSDLGALSGLTQLTELELNDTSVSDLTPLRGLSGLIEQSTFFGLTFKNCKATQIDPRIGEISRIADKKERAQVLFDYLKDWVPPEDAIDATLNTALRGPILAESLVDIEREEEQFHTSALTDDPAKPIDRRHDELVASLAFISGRLGSVSTENRLGQDVAESFADYSDCIAQTPVNGRILWFLANGVRAVLTDPYAAEALDGFDTTRLTGFLSESDALVQEYYPDAMRGAQFETQTDPEVLNTEVPKQLAAARDILESEDAHSIFAPSVSNTVEMLNRRLEGVRRGYVTAGTEAEREAAGKELQRVSVQITALVGRIKGRLTQWLKRTGNWTKVQAAHAKDHPVGTTAAMTGAVTGVAFVVQKITPVFEALWKLIGNLPLPF